MPSQIDLRSFDAFKAWTRAALQDAALDEGQLEALREVAARDDVNVHSINRSELSDGERAVAVLLMLLRDSPDDAKLSRISTNLADFFDRVISGKENTYVKTLRVDALGTDAFAGWGPMRVQGFGEGTFEIADTNSGRKVQLREKTPGELDSSGLHQWTPDALKAASDLVSAAVSSTENPLMQRFRDRLDEIEAKMLRNALGPLQAVREHKLGKLAEGAGALQDAIEHPKKAEYEVPQANIDAIGHALAAAVDNPPVAEAAKSFAVPLPQLKTQLAASIAELTDRDCIGLNAAMEGLSALAGKVTFEATRRIGMSETTLQRLLVFRAIEASLQAAGVHETIRNQPSLREAADALLKGSLLDGALQKLVAELSDPDPFGLHRGRALVLNNPAGFTRETPIKGVHALDGDEGVAGYQVVTGAGTWTIDLDGIAGPDRQGPTQIADFSIDALRTLTSVLLAASPDSVDGPLSWFRKTEERTNGGFSYAGMLQNLSAALAEKMQSRMDEIDEVVKALAPLGSFAIHKDAS